MKTRAVRDGDSYVLNGTKCWITGAGVNTHYTGHGQHRPEQGRQGHLGVRRQADDPGFSVGTKERKMGIKGSPTCEIYFEDCRIPADRHDRGGGHRLLHDLQTLDHTRSMIGAQAVGIAQGRARRASPTSRSAGSSARPSRSSRACSSCSPTWR
jgi:alkylation response protein AidB-like acyl-CoA dehydrogenase